MLFSVVPRDRKRGKWEYRRFLLNVCKYFCTVQVTEHRLYFLEIFINYLDMVLDTLLEQALDQMDPEVPANAKPSGILRFCFKVQTISTVIMKKHLFMNFREVCPITVFDEWANAAAIIKCFQTWGSLQDSSEVVVRGKWHTDMLDSLYEVYEEECRWNFVCCHQWFPPDSSPKDINRSEELSLATKKIIITKNFPSGEKSHKSHWINFDISTC